MMKTIKIAVLVLLNIALSPNSKAQGIIGTVFNQKQSSRLYNIQQIYALKVYAGYLKKGYNVVKDGAKVIGDIKDGEFSLHKDYFKGLRKVSPAIKRNEKVASIISMHAAMQQMRKQANRISAGKLTAEEWNSLRKLLSGLSKGASADLEQLLLTISDGMDMTDDERIERIEKIYTDMQCKYGTHRRLNRSIQFMISNKARHRQDTKELFELYNSELQK